jgi:hypothetical protein
MSNIKSRKISIKASEAIAKTFVESGELGEKNNALDAARDTTQSALQECINQFALASEARKHFDSLDPTVQFGLQPRYIDTDCSFRVSVDTPELTYNCSESYETGVSEWDWRREADPRTHTPNAWWWFDSRALEVILATQGAEIANKLDLRKELEAKMFSHPLLIASVNASRAYNDWRDNMYDLKRRIENDIQGRSVSQVLNAWPELVDAINKYYDVPVVVQQPLKQPLSAVIAEVTTPLITQAAE